MRTLLKIASVAALALIATVGCESRTDKTDGGGVLLSVSDFDGLPAVLDVSVAKVDGFASIGEVEIQNVVKDPTGGTSALMNVELEGYEVTFRRGDTGTRTPPALVQYRFGVIPVNGSLTLINPKYMLEDQLNSQPLRDLADFGVDRETNSEVVRLIISMRFYGKTLSGKKVDSAPATFSIDVVP